MKIELKRQSWSSDSNSSDVIPLKMIIGSKPKADPDGKIVNENLHEPCVQQCELCDTEFMNRYDLLVHNSEHIIIPLIKLDLFDCPECSERFFLEDELEFHVLQNHPTTIILPDLNLVKEESQVDIKYEIETDIVDEFNQSIKNECKEEYYDHMFMDDNNVNFQSRITFEDDFIDDGIEWNEDQEQFDVTNSPWYTGVLPNHKIYYGVQPAGDSSIDSGLPLNGGMTVLPQNDTNKILPSVNTNDITKNVECKKDDMFPLPQLKFNASNIVGLSETITESSPEIKLGLLGNNLNNEQNKPILEELPSKNDEIVYTKPVDFEELIAEPSAICKRCGMSFHNRFELIKHETSHLKMKRTAPPHQVRLCTLCDFYIAGNHFTLKRHKATIHFDNLIDRNYTTYTCCKCNLRYHSLTKHLINYHYLYICKCGMRFDAMTKLIDHIKDHHRMVTPKANSKIENCELCASIKCTRDVRHARTHDHKCPVCGRQRVIPKSQKKVAAAKVPGAHNPKDVLRSEQGLKSCLDADRIGPGRKKGPKKLTNKERLIRVHKRLKMLKFLNK